MDPQQIDEILTTLWIWIAGPLLLIAALVVTIRLRAPQFLRLGDAFKALRSADDKADGSLPPATAFALSTVATYGAAAAVGAATAVSLGGPGAIAWVWLFAILLAPLRMAETALARTAPPGRAGRSTGSLAARLLDDPVAGLRALGWALLILVPLTGFAFFGGTHGEAVVDAAGELLPGSALTLGLVVAGVGGAASLLPTKKFGAILGWIAVVSLFALFGAALVAFGVEPQRGFGGFVRAVTDAVYDAPRAGAFGGALAGEIATAAMMQLLPPLAATAGLDGAIHSEAQASTTRGQAAAALLSPLVYGVVATAVGLSLVATNAFSERTEDTRSLGDVSFYLVAFETTSQRLEQDRLIPQGVIRAEAGMPLTTVQAGTDRGMIEDIRFEEADGEPGNVAIQLGDGRAINVQSPSEHHVLENRPEQDLWAMQVRGQMLPDGGRLLATSMSAAGSPLTSRIALAALLLLSALGAAAWGLGLRKTLETRVPPAIARWTSLIPAIGLGLAATGVIPSFGAIGSAVAAVLVAVTSLALIIRGRDAAQLLRPKKSAAAEPGPKRAPKKKG